MSNRELPTIVIGAGPVGLATAAQLISRGMPVLILEAGAEIAASVRTWQHVKLFSPWKYNINKEAASLLASLGWSAPDGEIYPTGRELIEEYLEPLSRVPAVAQALRLNSRVVSVSRHGMDKVKTSGRDERPFAVAVSDSADNTVEYLGRAVIDASGTWTNPNPLGVNGLPAIGEERNRDRIIYGTPEVLGRDRSIFEGKRVLVVGAGHSAANVIVDLSQLKIETPETSIVWGTRSGTLTRVYGGGDADKLPERGALGLLLQKLVKSGSIEQRSNVAVSKVETRGEKIVVHTVDGSKDEFDLVVVSTGQRPDFTFLREVRLEIDPALECARAIGSLIDPNLHSCGTVRPHGHRELSHPESSFYIVGIKSYGRAPNFLMITGYEQARSVVAALAGDAIAANTVNLILPETGVCSRPLTQDATANCGDGPAKTADTCCVADEVAKTEGKQGCGCKSAA